MLQGHVGATSNNNKELSIRGARRGGASTSGPGRGAQKRPQQMRKAIAGRDIAGILQEGMRVTLYNNGVLSIRQMEGSGADASGAACAVLKRPWWSTVDRVDGGAGGVASGAQRGMKGAGARVQAGGPGGYT
ncbi:hypothetical protein C8F04DRAFT_1173323 [Mycena alexandri]|uniref:Uncharacterized protein n=1 Tax=Mycena alexandri TaxID=1745969 RepID=A0AAD6TGZ5_9AGAR|nr:hypothetical protein C8F04DRAFT_1173323 [Mycena alexandri]